VRRQEGREVWRDISVIDKVTRAGGPYGHPPCRGKLGLSPLIGLSPLNRLASYFSTFREVCPYAERSRRLQVCSPGAHRLIGSTALYGLPTRGAFVRLLAKVEVCRRSESVQGFPTKTKRRGFGDPSSPV